MPISASLATIIVERIFDAVVMLVFVFVNFPADELAAVRELAGFNIRDFAICGAVVFVGALLVFLAAAMFPQSLSGWCIGVVARFIPERLREKTLAVSMRFLDGLESLRSPQEALMVFFTSVVIWLLETGKYWFVMHAF